MTGFNPPRTTVDWLSTAIGLAAAAHAGQVDGQGKPFILHPLGVMRRLAEKGYDLELQICGVLHDTLEDTWVTYELLKQIGFSKRITDTVLRLSRNADNCNYEMYIELICTMPDAMIVKLADLEDNLDPARYSPVVDGLREKYEKAAKRLIAAATPNWGGLLSSLNQPKSST
ncbi:MAG TPA: HD domain-containing protein [Rugosimonospora sp.]|nr:HD domain-containing protein [Rugosimonospora sp.]